MATLRVSAAARYLGVHPQTLRVWADAGRVPSLRFGGERRFTTEALDAFAGVAPEQEGHDAPVRLAPAREALYVRVSGSSGQESSLAAQEAELRAAAAGEVVAVFKDKASGLRENRKGLDRLLERARAGDFEVVRVAHRDRLARFGTKWIIALLQRDGVTVVIEHEEGAAGGSEELLADFMALVSSFAGRLYGLRSREARLRLLSNAEDETKE